MDRFLNDIRITKETFGDTNGELFESTLLTFLRSAFSDGDKSLFLREFLVKRNIITGLISVSLFNKCVATILAQDDNRRHVDVDVGLPSASAFSPHYPRTVETPENSGTIVSAISEQTQQTYLQTQRNQSQQTSWIDSNEPPTSLDNVNLYINNSYLLCDIITSTTHKTVGRPRTGMVFIKKS